ncbi:MAG TPA: hypothetical protein VE863_00275 [Pyrinomonadaceae bacterium]|jgi:hypothetical protein|nr:hypothetical protein [Pyrinomonadaceae bacterium]
MKEQQPFSTTEAFAPSPQLDLQIEVLEQNIELLAAAGSCTSTSTSCSCLVDN